MRRSRWTGTRWNYPLQPLFPLLLSRALNKAFQTILDPLDAGKQVGLWRYAPLIQPGSCNGASLGKGWGNRGIWCIYVSARFRSSSIQLSSYRFDQSLFQRGQRLRAGLEGLNAKRAPAVLIFIEAFIRGCGFSGTRKAMAVKGGSMRFDPRVARIVGSLPFLLQ